MNKLWLLKLKKGGRIGVLILELHEVEKMEEKERLPNKRIFYGTQVKVFGTDPKNPEDGRIYLRTKLGWFERAKAESGDVILTLMPPAGQKMLESVGNGNSSSELFPLGPEYQKKICDELLGQLTISDFEIIFKTEGQKSEKLFTVIGVTLAILGLIIFGAGIYFWTAYSPTKFAASVYTQVFEQIHSAGISGIIGGISFEMVGWAIIAVSIFTNHKNS